MSVTLEIDTKKSLYKPIEIKIDGELFKVRKVTLGYLETIQALQKEAVLGSAAAIRKILELMLEGPVELLSNVTVDQLDQIFGATVEKALSPGPEEKNGQRPGPEKSRS